MYHTLKTYKNFFLVLLIIIISNIYTIHLCTFYTTITIKVYVNKIKNKIKNDIICIYNHLSGYKGIHIFLIWYIDRYLNNVNVNS